MNETYIGHPIDQGFLFDHFFLVSEVDENGRYAGFLEISNIGQLPPYSAASPADPLNHGIGGLHFLIG